MQLFTRKSKRRRRVLVVDDEMINRELLEAILSLNYDVETAANGVEALALLRKYQESGTQFSLILMDLLMPQMSGFRLLEECQADEALKEIPIIVSTSEKSAEVRSIRMGAQDFISKPYRMPEVILARCERIIELSEDKRLIHSIEKDPVTGLYIKVFFDAYIRRAVPDIRRPMDAFAFRLVSASSGTTETAAYKAAAGIFNEVFSDASAIACHRDDGAFEVFCEHRDDHESILARLKESVSGFDVSVKAGVYTGVDRAVDPAIWFERAYSACDSAQNGCLAYYSA